MLNPKDMPRLGFGLMRLPEQNGVIDMDEVCRMVDRYMKAGFNYFDTAYDIYHSGRSEAAAREAIVKRYPRDSFILSCKMPGWELRQIEDLDRIFEEQLTCAGVDYFDLYMLHGLEADSYDKYESFDAFGWAMQKVEEGKIRHFGFSYQGGPKLLRRILGEHPETEFVQIILNYADWNNPVMRTGKLYDVLVDFNIPIIATEPVRGGMLTYLKPELEAMYKAVRPDKSVASWALRYVGSLPGVMTIVSSTTYVAHVIDNLETMKDFEPLSENEKETMDEVTRIMLDAQLIGCTACRTCCDGCPMVIDIPNVFRSINTIRLYGDEIMPKAYYNGLIGKHGRASDCVACGQCESICPQHLPIIELMREAGEILDQ